MRVAAALAAVLSIQQRRAAADVPPPKLGNYCDNTHCKLPPFYKGVSIEVFIKDEVGAFDFTDFVTSTSQSVSCFDQKYKFDTTYGTLVIDGMKDMSSCMGKAMASQFNQSATTEAVQMWYDGEVLSFQVKPYGVCVLRRQNIYDPSDQTCQNFPQPPPAPPIVAPSPGYYCSGTDADRKTCFGDQNAKAVVHLIDSTTYDLSLSGQTPWTADCKGEKYTYSSVNDKLAIDLSDPSDCVTKAAQVDGKELDLDMWWNGKTIELATKSVGLCVLYGPKTAC